LTETEITELSPGGATIFRTDDALIDEQRALYVALKALAYAAQDNGVPAEHFVWSMFTAVAAVCSTILAPEHDARLVRDFSEILAAVRLSQHQTEGEA
jgi:hypothetical protein